MADTPDEPVYGDVLYSALLTQYEMAVLRLDGALQNKQQQRPHAPINSKQLNTFPKVDFFGHPATLTS